MDDNLDNSGEDHENNSEISKKEFISPTSKVMKNVIKCIYALIQHLENVLCISSDSSTVESIDSQNSDKDNSHVKNLLFYLLNIKKSFFDLNLLSMNQGLHLNCEVIFNKMEYYVHLEKSQRIPIIDFLGENIVYLSEHIGYVISMFKTENNLEDAKDIKKSLFKIYKQITAIPNSSLNNDNTRLYDNSIEDLAEKLSLLRTMVIKLKKVAKKQQFVNIDLTISGKSLKNKCKATDPQNPKNMKKGFGPDTSDHEFQVPEVPNFEKSNEITFSKYVLDSSFGACESAKKKKRKNGNISEEIDEKRNDDTASAKKKKKRKNESEDDNHNGEGNTDRKNDESMIETDELKTVLHSSDRETVSLFSDSETVKKKKKKKHQTKIEEENKLLDEEENKLNDSISTVSKTPKMKHQKYGKQGNILENNSNVGNHSNDSFSTIGSDADCMFQRSQMKKHVPKDANDSKTVLLFSETESVKHKKRKIYSTEENTYDISEESRVQNNYEENQSYLGTSVTTKKKKKHTNDTENEKDSKNVLFFSEKESQSDSETSLDTKRKKKHKKDSEEQINNEDKNDSKTVLLFSDTESVKHKKEKKHITEENIHEANEENKVQNSGKENESDSGISVNIKRRKKHKKENEEQMINEDPNDSKTVLLFSDSESVKHQKKKKHVTEANIHEKNEENRIQHNEKANHSNLKTLLNTKRKKKHENESVEQINTIKNYFGSDISGNKSDARTSNKNNTSRNKSESDISDEETLPTVSETSQTRNSKKLTPQTDPNSFHFSNFEIPETSNSTRSPEKNKRPRNDSESSASSLKSNLELGEETTSSSKSQKHDHNNSVTENVTTKRLKYNTEKFESKKLREIKQKKKISKDDDHDKDISMNKEYDLKRLDAEVILREMARENSLDDDERFLYLQDLLDQTRSADAIIATETEEKLKNLRILIDWDIPPAHKIEKYVSAAPLPEESKQLEELGVSFKRYTMDENEQIKKNWKEFCKRHDLNDDPTPFLKIRRNGKYILKFEARKNFVQFLGRGLPNRTLHSIYRRFKTIFKDACKTGRFTPEEDILILTYCDRVNRHHKFAELAKILTRDRSAIERRYRILKDTPSERIRWTLDSESVLVKGLLKATGLKNVEDLKHATITSEHYKKAAKSLNLPMFKVRPRWRNHIYPRLFSKNILHVGKIQYDIFKFLLNSGQTDWKKIDWDKMASQYEGFTKDFLRYILALLLHNYVLEENRKSLTATLRQLKKYVEIRESVGDTPFDNRIMKRCIFKNGELKEEKT